MIQKSKKFFWSIFISLILIEIIFCGEAIYCEASRRNLNLQKKMETSDIMHWTTEIHDKLFEVYVDRSAQTVLVKGWVENWTEKKKVEDHLKKRSPSTYQLFCEIEVCN